jgi:hypothetical protein
MEGYCRSPAAPLQPGLTGTLWALRRCAVQRPRPAKDGVLQIQMNGDSEAAAWLFGILIADEEGAPARTGGNPVVVSEHAVVPPRGRGRFLVPVGPPRVAAGSISAFNRLRPAKTRLVRSALASAIRVGASGPLMGNRVKVTGRSDGSAELADRWLVDHLRQVLGERELVMASGLRPGDTFSKPVLQLFRPDGTPVGFAKVGWNDVTVPRVRNEAEVLAGWDRERSSRLAAPQLLHAGEWAGRYVAVTAPMPPSSRRLRRRDTSPALATAAVYGSAPVDRVALSAAAYWKDLVADSRRLVMTGARSAGVLERLVDDIGERHLGVELGFGRWHGDWVTWNLALADGVLWAWDWEYSDPSVPVGLDVVHHLFQESFVGAGRPMITGMEVARREAEAILPALGLTRPEIDATVALHRAELLRRDASAEALGATPDRRLEPVALLGCDR